MNVLLQEARVRLQLVKTIEAVVNHPAMVKRMEPPSTFKKLVDTFNPFKSK